MKKKTPKGPKKETAVLLDQKQKEKNKIGQPTNKGLKWTKKSRNSESAISVEDEELLGSDDDLVLNEYEEFSDDENDDMLNDKEISDEDEIDNEEDEYSESGLSNDKITESMIKNWENELRSKAKSVAAFKHVQEALSAATESIKGDEKHKTPKNGYKVQGSKAFNSIIRLCLKEVPPALQKLFQLKTLSDRPVKTKKWTPLVPTLKRFLKDLIVVINSISEPSVVEALLKKGILPLLPFYIEFPTLSWLLTRQIAILWCTSSEKVRVLSLVALFRLLKSIKQDMRDKALRVLYISYINNSRFTSPSAWPLIDFMRMSLVELYSLDQNTAYRLGFIFIKQLAYHLRSAMILQKKERMQLVYNWQYVHSLHFWADLLAKTHPSPVLETLIYPLTQISLGVLTNVKSAKYFPMTFHICNILTELSSKTDNFIPLLPHLMEVLSFSKLNKRGQKVSFKTFDFNCVIKVSTAQTSLSAFTDGVIEQFLDCALFYLDSKCCSIAFPEFVLPCTQKLRSFAKKCPNSNYSKKIKQLVSKINENSEFINERRKDVAFAINDSKAIKNWEIETQQSNPPLRDYYHKWKAVKVDLKKKEAITMDDKGTVESDFCIDAVRKRQKEEAKIHFENFDEIFKDDDDGDIFEPPTKKQKTSGEDEIKSEIFGHPNKGKSTNETEDELMSKDDNDDFEDDVVQEMNLADYDGEEESDDKGSESDEETETDSDEYDDDSDD